MTRPAAACLLATMALLATAALSAHPLAGQRVQRAGQGIPEVDARLQRLIENENYRLITRDTLIAQGDTVRGDLLVAGATLTLEGVVTGNLFAAEANVFLRPSAVVRGEVTNAGGGLYRSELATVQSGVIDHPDAPYALLHGDGLLTIEGQLEEKRIEFAGPFGFRIPTYDRVSGLSLDWGAAYRFGGGRIQPRIGGWIGYRSDRGALNGGGEVGVGAGNTILAVGAEEATLTNEDWIRSDVSNSLVYLANGKDYRNYYESERRYAEVRHEQRRGRGELAGSLRFQLERDRSLAAGYPWSLLDSDERANPQVDPGTISSLILSAGADWVGSVTTFEGGGLLEVARGWAGGDHSFERFRLWGEFEMKALANHSLEVDWNLMGPLSSGDALPRQRWSFIGGSGTLRLFDLARFEGDRVVFVETTYVIPLPQRLRLPLLGVPDLELFHAFGMAWTRDVHRDLAQNLGARLQFFSVFVRATVDPAVSGSLEFDVGASWPFGKKRPWEQARQ